MTSSKPLTRWLIALLAATLLQVATASAAGSPGIQKIKDITIYEDEDFYSTFPSIVRRPDGDLLVAFRRAPNRRKFGDGKYSHSDPNSYLVSVRSKDSGQTWTKEPELIYAHPYGGSQDPCMVQLSDDSILCTSYGWAAMEQSQIEKLQKPVHVSGKNFVFMGGYILRSDNGGKSWTTILPAPTKTDRTVGIFGQPVPAFNRGAMHEGSSGRLYWVAQTFSGTNPRHTENHLMISDDKGLTWSYSSVVAADPKVQFNETSIYETPKKDLVAFMRTAGYDDHLAIARSTDSGKSFTWTDGGFQGHPFHAVRLPDKRVLLVYGYRHPPYGIRARVLNAECTDAATAPEVVLRDDGGGGDLGYPWVTVLSKKQALVVYYFNRADGPRTIESTLVELQ